MSAEIFVQYLPILGSVLYAGFGYAKAAIDKEGFDGLKFLRALGIGLGANTVTAIAGLPLEQAVFAVPFATVAIDQLISIYRKFTARKAAEEAREEVLSELEEEGLLKEDPEE